MIDVKKQQICMKLGKMALHRMLEETLRDNIQGLTQAYKQLRLSDGTNISRR
jgi:hypothetical protein